MFVLLAGVIALLLVAREYGGNEASALVQAIEIQGSVILGTPLTVDDAYLDADSGEVSLSRIKVANPAGFSDRDMIAVDTVEAHVDFTDHVIDWVRLSGLDSEVEFRDEHSNFEVVGRNIEHADKDKDKDEVGGRQQWRVDDVEFVGIHVRIEPDRQPAAAEFDAEGLSVNSLQGEARDLLRIVTMRFLNRVLMAAQNHVDDSRLAARLREDAGDLEFGSWLPRDAASE